MKIAREREHEATVLYNNLKINGRMYTLEQLGEDERARKEICEQANMTSNPKRTVSDRFPYEKGKEEKEGRAYMMMRNMTNTDRRPKSTWKKKEERDMRGTKENNWKQKMSKEN